MYLLRYTHSIIRCRDCLSDQPIGDVIGNLDIGFDKDTLQDLVNVSIASNVVVACWKV